MVPVYNDNTTGTSTIVLGVPALVLKPMPLYRRIQVIFGVVVSRRVSISYSSTAAQMYDLCKILNSPVLKRL